MRIRLVTHIPDEFVVRQIQRAMQGDGEFHRAQVGGQMAASSGYAVDNETAQFVRKLVELRRAQVFQIKGVLDAAGYNVDLMTMAKYAIPTAIAAAIIAFVRFMLLDKKLREAAKREGEGQ